MIDRRPAIRLSHSRPLSARFIALTAVQCLALLAVQIAVGAEPSILGIGLGLSPAAVRDLFGKSNIPLTEIDAETLSAGRPLAPLDGAKEVRLYFEKEALHKITILFEIPSREPTANNLMQQFEKEKQRLRGLYGEPARDVAEMKISRPEDRHEWLTRGRGYYQVLWQVGDRLKVTLWLYGEDAGIVFMETYESL